MIYIFHGDDQYASRFAFNQQIDQQQGRDIFRLDSKNANLDLINNFLNSPSLFASQKVLTITNLFSIPKVILDKIIRFIKDDSQNDIYIWQDKTLTPTQTKIFPKAQINHFPVNKVLFSCLNQIRPKNISKFIPLYQKVIVQEPFELFLFFVKNNLRKQITNYSSFDKKNLERTYIQLIELDFQSKNGQLAIPKEIALQRILINLIK